MAATTTTPPRLARYRGRAANHTAGIYADMTVDGPEIGTLVVVVDRAKNLPNLRTMGKQDPYCAARLGKEAKKTETDRRGGQTPRWDQELRFTVHESPDYRKIKVSVFNDDKRKTDLIGETWIELDELLRPGGGQGDAWHTLTVKGRYAGEIRIELTFYDSRPKVDRPRSRKQSNADSLSSDQRQAMLGPRQLPGGRPLPPDPAAAATPQVTAPDYAGMVPVPHSTPRSYHTPPPRETQYHDMNSSGSRYSDHDQNDLASNDAYARPLPNPRMSQSFMHSYHSPPATQASAELPASQSYNDGYDDQPNDYIPFSDDPYALEVAESRHGSQQDFQYHPQTSPPRHDRVQTLSGSPNPRPLPPIELPHAQSAPQLGPHGRASEFDAPFGGASNQHHQFQDYGSLPDDDGVYDSYETQSWSSSQNHHDVRHDSLGDCYEVGPPPPPIHRNSAPAIPKAAPRAIPAQQTNTPTRALHMSTNVADFERSASEPPQSAPPRGRQHMSRASYSPGHVPYQQHSVDDRFPQHGTLNNTFQPHLSPSADPSFRPRDEMAHDPRSQYNPGRYGSNANQARERPSSYQGPQAYDDYAPPRPLSFHEDTRRPRQDGPPLIRPRAISPGRNNTAMPAPQQQQYRTPRKSVSPNPSPANTQSSTPYSPDSFDSLNPSYSNQSTPDTSNKFEPTPMYSLQESSPTKPSPLAQSSTPADVPPLQINTRPRPHEGPILGSDGRIKDPSDHLPPSSYAPEPDRKEKRPSTIINIKSRFGPRDAREKIATAALSSPTSPVAASSPTDQRSRQQQQQQQQPRSPSGSSPLAPTHSSILNSNLNGGFNLSSPYPPPVPGKVPLGGYQSQVDEPDHFEMARLSLVGDDGYEGSEFGSAKSRHALQGVRVRKSRWGA